MKTLSTFMQEGLKIGKDFKYKKQYNYFPKTKEELKKLIDKLIAERGTDADLNDIDTSEIEDMSKIFEYSTFNGDISKWDVSNVITMEGMFRRSKFTGENGDISKWDVSNVKDMFDMFSWSNFNQDISNWDVKSVQNMKDMFWVCPLEKNLPAWYKD